MGTPLLLGVLLLLFAVCTVFWVTRRRSETGRIERNDSGPMNIPGDSRSAFIVCVFSMLGKLTGVDGRVSPEERAKVESFIDSQLKLDRKTKRLALTVFRDAPQSPLEFRDYAEKFRKTYPERFRLFDSMIEILVEVSVADGVLSPREDKLIRSAALLLGLTEPAYEGIKAKYLRAGHTPQ